MNVKPVTGNLNQLVSQLKRVNQAMSDYQGIPSVQKSLKAEAKKLEKQIVKEMRKS